MKSSGWALVQYDWYPYKRKFEYRQVQREVHVKTQGMTIIQAREGTQKKSTLP